MPGLDGALPTGNKYQARVLTKARVTMKGTEESGWGRAMWEKISKSRQRESMYLKKKGAIGRAFSCGCGVSNNEPY